MNRGLLDLGELAARSDLTPSALRDYESIGRIRFQQTKARRATNRTLRAPPPSPAHEHALSITEERSTRRPHRHFAGP